MTGGVTQWSGTAPLALVLIALVADALLGGLPGISQLLGAIP